MLADAGIKAQARAPMTAVAKLVFGVGCDKTRLTEFAAALQWGHRQNLPLGGFTLTDEDFAELTKLVLSVAERSAKGRVVSVLEGGYNLRGLGTAASAHVKALCGG